MKIRSLSAVRPWAVSCIAAVGLAFLLPPAVMAAPQMRTLPGAIPAVVTRLTPMGVAPATNEIELAIGLSLRDPQGLNTLLQQLYDPSSPNFHHFISPEDFTARFGPSQADYQAAVAFAQANGLTVKKTYSNRLVLDVSGTTENVDKAFQVALHTYQHPSEKRTFYAPDTAPAIPAALAILDVSGLNNYYRPHPKYRVNPKALIAQVTPKVGSAPDGGYLGDDFRNAYLPGVKLTGQGQKVALVQFDGYYPSDIAAYEAFAGRNSVSLTNILLNGFSGSPTGSGGDGEVTLDIDMVIAIAPGIDQILVYEGDPSNFHPNDVLNQIATDNAASQVSCSWGWGGGPGGTTDQILLQMAAQGQTFFNASGDSDAFPPGFVDDPFQAGTPSSSPYVTQVGGTTLTTTGPGGKWESEKVWNWGGGSGSSGGVSDFYSTPDWQQGLDMTANGGSTTGRNIPDVALTGDNVFIVASDGVQQNVGGTSCAAPLWGGLMALINEQAGLNGLPPVGFLNPTIYNVGKGDTYNDCFHDIKTGNNFNSSSPNLYRAVAGYDLCTGWGTPAGQHLIDALSAPYTPNGFLLVDVNPASGSALIGGFNQDMFIRVSDAFGITNATVTATINGTNLVVLNDGTTPDINGGDSVYSAAFDVPSMTGALTLTVTATAPAEIGVTNRFYYPIISLPANDNFANATKIPALGGTYLANNRFATMETNEPAHNGNSNAVASLWWTFTPTVSTNILVDTSGSRVDNILAIYTNNVLTNLAPVAATSSSLKKSIPSRLSINARAGVAYRIAVASPNTNTLGSVKLQVTVGGVADVVAPQVAVTIPQLSGETVSNSPTLIAGTAVDPQPGASGVYQVLVSVNGKPAYPALGTSNWTSLATLVPGFNAISVKALDESGNLSLANTFEFNYLFLGAPNDFFAQATWLTADAGTNILSTVNTTKEMGEPNHAGNSGGRSVWWKFQPSVDGLLNLSTFGSDFDTLLAVYTGDAVNDLTLVGANDDASPGAPGGYSSLAIAVHSNVVYAIALDGFDGVSGVHAVLSYSFAPGSLYHLAVNSVGGGSTDPGAVDVPSNAVVSVTAVADPGYQFDSWDGAVVSFDNPVSVKVSRNNLSLTAHFRPVVYSDGFETGDFSALNWTMGGNQPWLVQSNVFASGQFAARSGPIGNSQTSSLVLKDKFRAGPGSFEVRVSSELGWDYLKFLVDGTLVQQWSGDIIWSMYNFSIPTDGTHTLEWRYEKDSSGSSGLDAAFLDNINVPLAVATNGASAGHLVLHQLGEGNFYIDLLGQTNQTYWVQVSTDLKTWQTISTNVATSGFVRITDSIDATTKARFYRTVVPPLP